MPTLVATVGSASANSFVTVAECDTYCDARLNASAWTDETDDDQKIRALIGATQELSSRAGWIGDRASSTQALAWPRINAENPDSAWPGHTWYRTTEIPQRVKDATCELALQSLILGTTDLAAADPTLNVRRKVVDVLETEYFEPQQRVKGLGRFPSVIRYIAPLLSGSSSSVPIIRG